MFFLVPVAVGIVGAIAGTINASAEPVRQADQDKETIEGLRRRLGLPPGPIRVVEFGEIALAVEDGRVQEAKAALAQGMVPVRLMGRAMSQTEVEALRRAK